MLKIDCPSCGTTASSPFLVEKREVECEGCGATYPVRDVYIAVGHYIFYRDVILGKTNRYARLLREIQKEVEEIEVEAGESKPHRDTARTLQIFISMLKELLDGCRARPRVPGGDTAVECLIDGKVLPARLVNISSTGLCLSQEDNTVRFGRGRMINVTISDRRLGGPLGLKAWVVWTTEKGVTGMKFIGLDETTQTILRDLVAAKSQEEEKVA